MEADATPIERERGRERERAAGLERTARPPLGSLALVGG